MNRFLSRLLTPLFLKTPITPNQVTFLSLLFGILSGIFFSFGQMPYWLYGALAYQIAALLDNCDGDIARAKNMRSVFGGWLDVTSDVLVDIAFFLGLTLGVLKIYPDKTLVTLMGVLCLLGALFNFIVTVWGKVKGFGPAVHGQPHPEGSNRDSLLFKIIDNLREGDSSWLVLLFMALNQAFVFLAACVVYVQVLWLSAFLMNTKWLLKKTLRENS